MSQKITINPNDQSWIGKRIWCRRFPENVYYTVLFVGQHQVFLTLGGFEDCYPLKEKWELYEEPEENCEHVFSQKNIETNISYCDKCGIERPQGHHCSGKCTKLIGSISVIQEENAKANKAKLGFEEYKKEKECAHDFESGWDFDSNKEIKCRKCRPKKEQSPFWLKVGDVIRPIFDDYMGFYNNNNYKIYSIYQDDYGSNYIEFETIDGRFDRSIFTPEKFKKIKLVSPVFFKLKDSNGNWWVSTCLYSNYPEKPDFSNCDQIIWPAKDQFGREIWYEV